MTKTPRRSVAAPGEAGALRVQPRNSAGRFVKVDAPPIVPLLPEPVATVDDMTQSEISAPESAAPETLARDVAPPKRKRAKAAATPAQLVARVTRAIERELEEIESIVGGTPTEGDQRARRLASLARTLAEVTKMRDAATDVGATRNSRTTKADGDDDALPRDLDDFRRTLERRLAQLVDAGAIGPDRDDERG